MHKVIGIVLAVGFATGFGLRTALQSAEPPGSAPPGCKTYPTAADQVSLSGGVRTVVSYTAHYDPARFQVISDLTYTDNRGIRFANHTVTEYASTAEFVREVDTIPPLKLYLRATITGDSPATTVNTFDGDGRLQRFVNTAAGAPPQTTTYSAWDRSGRPTAGSIVMPDYRQTITLAYDAVARTTVTTYTTIPSSGPATTAVSKDTYDVNGNAISQEWRTPSGTTTTTSTFRSTAVTCK